MNAAKKILFATDYSDLDDRALTYAASLARGMEATLLVVHVSQLEQYPVGELFDEEPHPSDADIAELNAVKPPDPRIPCEHRLLYGDPAQEIVKLADEEHVEAIVVGTRGRSRLPRLMGGSVAKKIQRTAHCPVITYDQALQPMTTGGEGASAGEAAPSRPTRSRVGPSPESNLQRTVREWTSHRPEVYRFFASRGIDVFWDGDKPLADVCSDKGLDPRRIADELSAVLRPMYRESGSDWHQATISELCDHIEATHHEYLRRELPRLGELVARTVQASGNEHPELEDLRTIFEQFRNQLLEHVETEGTVLFPELRKLEADRTSDLERLTDSSGLIRQMKEDHDDIEAALSQIRKLTNGYAAPASASADYRRTLGALWELEANLHLNVHEEDDILFSKALLH